MAVADPNVSDSFIREVDDDLRQEQLEKAWKKYGNYVIGGAVAIVLLVAGREAYRAYDADQRESFGQRYHAAFDLASENQVGAAAAFDTLAADSSGGQALLAALQAAALKGQAGDAAGASADYFEIADNSDYGKTFRDLATVLGALNGLDSGDAGALQSRLAPLMDGTNAYRHTARQLAAMAAAKAGDGAKAKQLLDEIAKDATAPQSTRARATELAAAVDG